MSRTVHYRTCETVLESEFCLLKAAIERINSQYCWEVEGLKLWREGILSDGSKVWGFTKVGSKSEAEVVICAVKYLSSLVPRLKWIIMDEGFSVGRFFIVKNGDRISLDC